MPVLLLTGSPGVGKTTVIRTVAERVRRRRLGGFYTEEIRVRGERQGFALVTFEGRRAVIARVGDGGNRDQRGRPRVGKYAVDLDVIGAMARSTIASEDAAELYLVDEIGKMECLSPEFVSAMRALLDKRLPVVATVGQRGGGFIEEVKRRRGVVLWGVTRANRDEVPARVLQWIDGRATNGAVRVSPGPAGISRARPRRRPRLSPSGP